MRAGDAVGAAEVYRTDLERNRKNPRALFGLWKALERQGRAADAARAKAEFDVAWAGADTTLSDVPLQPARRR
jgi:hypothetical protein